MSTTERSCTIPLHKPSLKEKLFFFSSGIIVSIPIATSFEPLFLSLLLSYFSIPTAYATPLLVLVLAPLIEEFGKAFPLLYRHGETKKSVMTLGFMIGLGFGIFEFAEYVLVADVFFVFRLPGIFFHAASTSIVGYGIANKKPIRFYLVAVALHFANNVAAWFAPLFTLILLIFAVAVYYWQYLYQRTPDAIIPY
jgi:RsiW-degrading membrane proteinase PrsW (M82 family)